MKPDQGRPRGFQNSRKQQGGNKPHGGKPHGGKPFAGKKKPQAEGEGDVKPTLTARQKEYKKSKQQSREMGQMHVTATKAAVSAEAAMARKGGRKRVKGNGEDLIDSFKERLSGGTFRMLNEQIYTTPSVFAGQLLRDRETFDQYHAGYRRQVALWPVNPVDLIVGALKGDKRGRFVQHKSKHLPGHIPNGWVIADMGCGDAAIAKAMKDTNTVHSFDFCAPNELVTACDMANVPLEKESVDIAIFSLSLMSTNYLDYVYEAHRILRPNKLLKIAEVRSRLPDPERFAMLIESIGFKLDWWGVFDDYFCCFDFVRLEGEPNREPFNADFDPCSVLAPCLYKRR